jgi:hypothetical protein
MDRDGRPATRPTPLIRGGSESQQKEAKAAKKGRPLLGYASPFLCFLPYLLF